MDNNFWQRRVDKNKIVWRTLLYPYWSDVKNHFLYTWLVGVQFPSGVSQPLQKLFLHSLLTFHVINLASLCCIKLFQWWRGNFPKILGIFLCTQYIPLPLSLSPLPLIPSSLLFSYFFLLFYNSFVTKVLCVLKLNFCYPLFSHFHPLSGEICCCVLVPTFVESAEFCMILPLDQETQEVFYKQFCDVIQFHNEYHDVTFSLVWWWRHRSLIIFVTSWVITAVKHTWHHHLRLIMASCELVGTQFSFTRLTLMTVFSDVNSLNCVNTVASDLSYFWRTICKKFVMRYHLRANKRYRRPNEICHKICPISVYCLPKWDPTTHFHLFELLWFSNWTFYDVIILQQLFSVLTFCTCFTRMSWRNGGK